MKPIIKKIKEYAERELASDPAHSFDHVLRVYNVALNLAKGEDIDQDVLEAAVLLHDIGRVREENDTTGNIDHAVEGAKMARPILERLGFSEKQIGQIQDCIKSHRYRNDYEPQTLEAKIIFDADKLDTVGAVGVARWFVWVGKNNAHIYRQVDIKEYIKENMGGKINGKIKDKTMHSPQINWETKDKHVLDYLYTDKAKKLAKERLAFSRNFLARLEAEVTGDI